MIEGLENMEPFVQFFADLSLSLFVPSKLLASYLNSQIKGDVDISINSLQDEYFSWSLTTNNQFAVTSRSNS